MKSYEQYKRLIRFFTSLILLCLEVGIYWIAWTYHFSDAAGTPFFKRGDWLMAAVYSLLLLFFTKMYGGFKVGYFQKNNIIYSHILSIFLVNIISYLQIALLAKRFLNPLLFIIMCVFDVIVIVIWTIISDLLFKKIFPPRQMLLIYGNRPSLTLMHKMNCRKDRYEICKIVHINVGVDKLKELIRDYDSIIICDVPSTIRNTILKYCYGRSIRVYITPKISDILIRSAEEIHLFDTPLLLARNKSLSLEQQAVKRSIDIVISAVTLIIASPLMLFTGLAIKAYDKGPVFYKQKRLTINGREFYVYKFRSMKVDAEKDGVARLASSNDNRITPVGNFIRKVRLDELPQLWNILKGDMSIVGPRPERPEIANQYKMEMPEFDYRLKVKAGLTGYAQIYGKYNTTPYDKLKLDLTYVQQYSIILDIKLMILTVKILFMKESTEGVAEGQTTATLDEIDLLHEEDHNASENQY